LRRIDLRVVTLLVWIALVSLVAVYRAELRWAVEELPQYLEGDVSAPAERSMYRKARRLIRENEELPRAEELLRRSYEIDPTSEAGYWLAVLYEKRDEPERAIAAYRAYLEIDATMIDAWISAIELESARGARDAALELARRGVAFFEAELPLQRPEQDGSVESRFNEKAVETYAGYRESLQRLRSAVRRLEGDAAPSPD